ncbi:GMC oxidoreductase [Actinospica sp.]|jgi:cholesterol oxidase|uniref:GMC oxidoreductase n=1 Tax=Actinospica sp. TaxID=1872142 RepID=UPI002B8D5115|nr:GMC oxidoreductase [Actinospica sp.]HWG23276.1 GMC oxidoreductase [Actinospica sp.]
MTEINRRRFLTGAAAVGAVTAVSSVASAGPAKASTASVPLTASTQRAVVIGSGFGGGVTALRLAQAGVKVLVLERGKWWPTGPNAQTFPHAAVPDSREIFYSSWTAADAVEGELPYAGLEEKIVGDNITAVVGAGVGGGSLVYQGMTLQPTEEVFSTWFPSGYDYSELNSVYYPRVAQMLQLETAPDTLINSKTYLPSRVFAANVQAAGYELEKIPMPIDWTYALDELAGAMLPSYTNGDCAYGVNNGGKHSVDVTYIAQAQATGNVTVQVLSNVTRIARGPNGTWLVYVDVTDTSGNLLSQQIITTSALFVNAGTCNTSKLLVRASAIGDIPDLPEAVGQGYGSNGDQIYLWQDNAQNLGTPQGGPVVYGSFQWDDPTIANTVIQASMPPIGVDLSGLENLLPSLAFLGEPLLLNLYSTILVGYGVSSVRGKFVYNSSTDAVDLQWPAAGDATLDARINQRITAIAGADSTVTNTNTLSNTTWHSLGGACMNSVCDLEGRVLGQRGLYVLDGALMPGTTAACNPSMTIAAIAERALDQIVLNDVGTVF